MRDTVYLQIHWTVDAYCKKEKIYPRLEYGGLKRQHYWLALRAFNGIPVCYLLMKGNDIVYVGSSRNLWSRIRNHCASEKKFDTIWYIAHRKEEEAQRMEAYAINRVKPKYNKTLKNKRFNSKYLKAA